MTNLNPQQKKAAEKLEGPVLVLAGAGAGKTKTLTARIINLIESGVAPQNILAITFTNKAAKEMKERVLGEISKNSKLNFPILDYGFQPFISTFHSLGLFILKENAQELKLNKYFSIYDRDDTKKTLKEVLKILDLDKEEWSIKSIISFISKNKGNFVDYEKFSKSTDGNHYTETMAKIWGKYEELKEKDKALDFDDLLLEAVKLLERKENLREHYLRKWSHIHIDEYQDTNKVQYKMAELLTHPEKKNIFAVGDPDQCFVEGTKILTIDGYKKIQDIKKDEFLSVAGGRGRLAGQRVLRVSKRRIKEEIYEIKTKKGYEVKVTGEHIFFGKLPKKEGLYYIYFMYKKNIGFRIGIVQGVRKSGYKDKSENGLIVRLNQEKAERIWILKIVNSEREARYYEALYSLSYGIPTTVFFSKGRGIIFNQKDIEKLHKEIKSREKAEKIFKEFGLSFDHPHYLPQGTVLKNSKEFRNNLRLTMFSDKRISLESPWGASRISINSSDLKLKNKLEKAGFKTRKSKGGDKWRLEITSLDYGFLENKITEILNIAGGKVNLVRSGFFVEGEKFSFLPVSSLREKMIIPVVNKNKIVEDEIVEIKKKKYNGWVYDLDVENTHNYISNSIVCHNCIYSWRGAELDNILKFDKNFKGAENILMEQNYRSTKNIIEASNAVIQKNKKRFEKKLFTENEEGDKILIYTAFNEREEAEFVAKKIKEENEKGISFDEIAVLYRANFQSRILEEKLLKAGIPYQVLGTKFFDRAEVKDLMSYVRLAVNSESQVDLKRVINVPKRGIGKASVVKIFSGDVENLPAKAKKSYQEFQEILAKIGDFASQNPPSKTIEFVIEILGFEKTARDLNSEDALDRLANMFELVEFAKKYDEFEPEEALEKFLDEVALMSDQDTKKDDKNNPRVKLMTIHASKGLEFEAVFLTGAEEILFSPQIGEEKKKIEEKAEEERRLFYVAMTRAKKKLFISWASMRTTYGQTQNNFLVSFVEDIPDYLIEEDGSFGAENSGGGFEENDIDVLDFLDW